MSGLHKGEYLRCSSPFSYTFINFLCQKDAEDYGKRGFAALVDNTLQKIKSHEKSQRLESRAFLCQGQGQVSIKYYGPVGGLKNMCFIISDLYPKQ